MKTLRARKSAGLVILTGLAAAALGIFLALGHANAAIGPNAIAIDTDTVTAGVQSGPISKNPGDTFTVGVNITVATDPYSAYQSEVSFNSSVIQVTAAVENKLGNAVTGGSCSGATFDNPTGVTFEGCAWTLGNQTNTGITATYTFQCMSGGGTTALHLDTNAEVGAASGTNFGVDASATYPDGVEPAVTGPDIAVNCGQPAGPTFTPTNTSTPTATNTPCGVGGCPTNTATATSTATSTANANVKTATPTPGGETATATNTPGGSTAVPTTAGGGPGGVAASPTKPGGGAGAGITGPNTGTGDAQGGSGNGMLPAWLIIGGLMLVFAGGALYVRTRGRNA